MLKDILKSHYHQNSSLQSHVLLDKFLQYDDNKIMRLVKRLLEIYSSRSRKRKLTYLLKWQIQKEKLRNIGSSLIKHKKRANCIPHLNQNPKEKGIRCLNEYSRNVNLLKKANSTANVLNNQHSNYFNSLSMNIAHCDSFSISKRKNALRLNSNTYSQSLSYKEVSDSVKSKSQVKNSKPTNKAHKGNSIQFTKEKKIKFFNSLNETANRQKENRRKLEMEKENKFNETCTFKPLLYKSQSYVNIASVPFLGRLCNYEQSKNKRISELKEEIESQMPKPQSKPPLTSRSNEDLSTEIKEYLKRKKEKLRQMEKDVYQEQGITFKPTLNDEKNKCIRDTITVRNRNFIERRDGKLDRLASNEVKECTFVPYVNSSPFEYKLEESIDVGLRLYDYKNRYAANKEYIKKYYEVEYSFKPSISKNTEQILQNKHQKKMTSKRHNEKDLKVISERATQEHNEEERSVISKCEKKAKPQTSYTDKLNNKLAHTHHSLKISIGSLSDERALELAKMNISGDDSLEKFQKFYKPKQYNHILNDNKENTAKRNKEKKKHQQSNKRLIKNLDFYDHLDFA